MNITIGDVPGAVCAYKRAHTGVCNSSSSSVNSLLPNSTRPLAFDWLTPLLECSVLFHLFVDRSLLLQFSLFASAVGECIVRVPAWQSWAILAVS